MLEYLNSDLPMPELSLLVDFAPQMGRELPSFLLSDLEAMECNAQICPEDLLSVMSVNLLSVELI